VRGHFEVGKERGQEKEGGREGKKITGKYLTN